MGADALQYDSTGAGEMVKSNSGQIMEGGFPKLGMGPGNGPVPSGGMADGVGNTGGNAEGGPLPSSGGSAGGFARPGGHQGVDDSKV